MHDPLPLPQPPLLQLLLLLCQCPHQLQLLVILLFERLVVIKKMSEAAPIVVVLLFKYKQPMGQLTDLEKEFRGLLV